MRDLWRTWLRNRHESKQWNELVLGQPAFWTGEPTLWYCCIDRQWSYIVYLPRGDKYFSISCVSNVEIIALEEFFSRVDKMLKRKKGEKKEEAVPLQNYFVERYVSLMRYTWKASISFRLSKTPLATLSLHVWFIGSIEGPNVTQVECINPIRGGARILGFLPRWENTYGDKKSEKQAIRETLGRLIKEC